MCISQLKPPQTKYYRLDGLNNKNYFCHSSRGWENPRSRFWQSSDSLPDLQSADLSVCPHMIERERDFRSFFLFLTLQSVGLELHPMTSVPPYKPYPPPYKPSGRQGFNKRILEEHSSDHNKAPKAEGDDRHHGEKRSALF